MDSKLNDSPLYSVLVAGDIDISKYDSTKTVEPYVAYEFSKRKEIRLQAIEIYKEILKNNDKSNTLLNSFISIKLNDVEEMTDEEYFESITQGMEFDKETGDAITTINPNGKYRHIIEATNKSAVPLYGMSYECKVGELCNKEVDENIIKNYEKHWDYLMTCADTVKETHLTSFKDKETYVSVMTEPFFYNAFVSEETGWLEQGDYNQIEWVLNFRERFIDNLPKDTKLKVYNFIK
jgi:hypothetical protein